MVKLKSPYNAEIRDNQNKSFNGIIMKIRQHICSLFYNSGFHLNLCWSQKLYWEVDGNSPEKNVYKYNYIEFWI